MKFLLTGLDHVQLAMPAGQEERAEDFYSGLLGLTRLPKPEPLAARGGCWFSNTRVVVHLGVEADFRPAEKAHPAIRVQALEDLARLLEAAEIVVRWSDELPETRRFYVDDPFGNRLEFVDGD